MDTLRSLDHLAAAGEHAIATVEFPDRVAMSIISDLHMVDASYWVDVITMFDRQYIRVMYPNTTMYNLIPYSEEAKKHFFE